MLISIGVPHGSVFGSLLFLVSKTDLPNCMKDGNFILFGDYFSGSDDLDSLLRDSGLALKRNSEWFLASKW